MSDTDDLPPAYQAAREADAAFWAAQEKRVQGATGQPACTLSGISTQLINLPGHFAVVVHGEDECAACFYHFGPSAHQFFCTGLTEKHFVTGETAEPLRECLRAVVETVDPEAIFVLGACPIEVIGDRFENVVEEVAADFPDVPMIAMHTSGLKVGSQTSMLDWIFSTLAGLPQIAPSDPGWRNRAGELGVGLVDAWMARDDAAVSEAVQRAAALGDGTAPPSDRCLNVLGLPETGRAAWREILADVGLHVVASYPYDCTLDDWRAIGHAQATFVLDRTSFPKTVGVLEGMGQQVIEVPLPVGVGQTEAFFRTIGRAYGVEEALVARIAEARASAAAELEAFRARHGALRVAMGLRMLNNYETDQLAKQGTGDFTALLELGFAPTLLVQGPDEKRDKIATLFQRHGIDHPFEMFAEPWTISKHIDGDRYDAAYLADHCRAECRKAGVPHIVSRELDPFFEGVSANVRYVEQALSRGGR